MGAERYDQTGEYDIETGERIQLPWNKHRGSSNSVQLRMQQPWSNADLETRHLQFEQPQHEVQTPESVAPPALFPSFGGQTKIRPIAAVSENRQGVQFQFALGPQLQRAQQIKLSARVGEVKLGEIVINKVKEGKQGAGQIDVPIGWTSGLELVTIDGQISFVDAGGGMGSIPFTIGQGDLYPEPLDLPPVQEIKLPDSDLTPSTDSGVAEADEPISGFKSSYGTGKDAPLVKHAKDSLDLGIGAVNLGLTGPPTSQGFFVGPVVISSSAKGLSYPFGIVEVLLTA